MDEFEEGEKAVELIKEDVEFVMKGKKVQMNEHMEDIKISRRGVDTEIVKNKIFIGFLSNSVPALAYILELFCFTLIG